MNSLTITQTKNNGIIEGPVPNQVVTKLYNIGKDDDENQTLTVGVDTTDENRPVSTVSGRIRVNSAFANELEYLAVKFPDLEINSDSTYIYFEDPEVERVLIAAGIGDGVGIAVSDAANATFTNNTFKNNTAITSFNEFPYFTRANTNPPIDLFRGCTNLSSINLQNASTISQSEFQESGITTVNVPNITTIGESAFSFCTSLTTVVNLGNVTSIPSRTFYCSKNLESVVLPSSCTSIGNISFRSGNDIPALKTINLENVISIGAEAFTNCQYLDIDVSDLQNCISLGDNAFNTCFNIHGELYLPKLISLGNQCFRGCTKISKVTCLGKITQIPNNMLYKHPSPSTPLLTEVYIPYECTSIAANAFNNCSNLTTLKQYTDSVDDWVEGETPTYTDISRVTTFGSNCFQNCSQLQLSASALTNVTTIGEYAFQNCSSLTGTLNLPNLVSIGNGAFQQTNITSVQNLGQVSEIGDPFWNCTSITEIVLPTTLRKSSSFYNTHVSKLIYPYGFTEKIAGNMCGGEQGRYLQYIQFPSTVTKIVCDDMYRDSGNSRIRCHIVVQATTPPNTNRNPSDTGGSGFGWGRGDPSQANWYVPDAVVNTYKADTQWSSIADYIFPISQLETDSPTCWVWYQANKDYGVPTQS